MNKTKRAWWKPKKSGRHSAAGIVVTAFDGVSATARLLGIDRAAVSQWKRKGKVPQDHWDIILKAARDMQVRVTLDDLRHGRG